VRRSLLALPLLVVLLLAGPASAHTRLVGELPASGSTVPTVTQVVLEFSDDVQPDLSTVAVTGADGVDRSQGPPVLQDGSRVVQALSAPLAAGRWTVAYRVVARDGHPVVGSHVFDVAAPAAGAEPSGAAEVPEPSAPATPPQPTGQPSGSTADPSAEPAAGRTPLATGGSDAGFPLLPVAAAGLGLAGLTGLLLARGVRRSSRP
jgi:methionine-rich copper-binding protein CopC